MDILHVLHVFSGVQKLIPDKAGHLHHEALGS